MHVQHAGQSKHNVGGCDNGARALPPRAGMMWELEGRAGLWRARSKCRTWQTRCGRLVCFPSFGPLRKEVCGCGCPVTDIPGQACVFQDGRAEAAPSVLFVVQHKKRWCTTKRTAQKEVQHHKKNCTKRGAQTRKYQCAHANEPEGGGGGCGCI